MQSLDHTCCSNNYDIKLYAIYINSNYLVHFLIQLVFEYLKTLMELSPDMDTTITSNLSQLILTEK